MDISPDIGEAEFIDSVSLATAAGVSRQCVANWRAAGYLPRPCYKSRNATLWRRQDLLEWIRAGCPIANPRRALETAHTIGMRRLLSMLAPHQIECDEAVLSEKERLADEMDSIESDAAGEAEQAREQAKRN